VEATGRSGRKRKVRTRACACMDGAALTYACEYVIEPAHVKHAVHSTQDLSHTHRCSSQLINESRRKEYIRAKEPSMHGQGTQRKPRSIHYIICVRHACNRTSDQAHQFFNALSIEIMDKRMTSSSARQQKIIILIFLYITAEYIYYAYAWNLVNHYYRRSIKQDN
jgi:hypothetical protein